MAENYKHLYEQMKKMVVMYQDEVVPGMRKTIEDLEKNQIKVRCKDCTSFDDETQECYRMTGFRANDFCSYGERRNDV